MRHQHLQLRVYWPKQEAITVLVLAVLEVLHLHVFRAQAHFQAALAASTIFQVVVVVAVLQVLAEQVVLAVAELLVPAVEVAEDRVLL
jgi:hypothetical protein